MSYRKDISGLRAIAVLLVIFFHIGLPVSGGFIGVDVFFVLSGFLITSIIQRDLITGQFSFKAFYLKRVRRIFPVLLLVIFVTCLVAWFTLLPDSTFRRFAQSAGLSFLSFSNFYFNNITDGYWGLKAESIPLLHTWSLSVEEQFYMLWPVLMLLLHKFIKIDLHKKTLLITTILLVIVSQYMALNHPNSAYYLLPARAFELLSGATLALFISNLKKFSLRMNNSLSFIGLVGIIYSAFFLTKSDVFPGFNALIVCISTISLLLSGKDHEEQGMVNRYLSSKTICYIGLISYSLYLWHWPIVAFLNYLSIEKTLPIQLGIIALTFLLSVMSYHFIEQPFRFKYRYSFKKTILLFWGIPFVLLAIFIIEARETNGFIDRFEKNSNDSIRILSSTKYSDCTPEYCNKDFLNKFESKVDTAKFLLIGDSHAGAIEGFINVLANDADIHGSTISHGGTPFLMNIDKFSLNKQEVITKFSNKNQTTFNTIKNASADTVILAGRYGYYLLPNTDDVFYKQGDVASEQTSKINFKKSFTATIDAIEKLGKKVIIVKDVPDFPVDLSKCPIVKNVFGNNLTCRTELPVNLLSETQHFVNNYFDELTNTHPNVTFITPSKILCKKDICSSVFEGFTVYRDNNHLNYIGAKMLGDEYITKFTNPLK